MSDAVLEEPQTEEEKPQRSYHARAEVDVQPSEHVPAQAAQGSAQPADVQLASTAEVQESSSVSTDEADKPQKKTRVTRVRKAATRPTRSASASESSVSSEGEESVSEVSQDTGDIPSGAEAAGASEETKSDETKPKRRTHRGSGSASEEKHSKGSNNHQKGSSQQKKSHYRSRRQHQQNRREPVVPQTTKEDLAKLKVADLRSRAEELDVDHKGLKKADLVDAVFAASIKAEGFVETAGILDILSDGYGFLRTKGYLPSEDDVYVGTATIRRNGLRKGDYITGQTRPARSNEKYAALQKVETVNDIPLEELSRRIRFADLTPVFPDERLVLEHGRSAITARVIDLCAPIGKGQRGLIVSPPKAGKTTILKDIAASIAVNNPEVHLMCLLVDERPEEVTDMERSIKGEVISSTFDMPSENHIAVSELVIERAKRLVENGCDVVILLDSLTRLARAYNLAQPASGRILSGGVDSTALYPPKKFLGAARNIEGGGSLTILASALIETGSKMDEVIFEEFKGTGNMEVKLDRQLADRRIFPAIDPVASGTRREDLLLDPQEAPLIWAVRRILANRNNTERAMESLVKSLQQTKNNQEFLVRAAKKAQGHHFEEGTIEF